MVKKRRESKIKRISLSIIFLLIIIFVIINIPKKKNDYVEIKKDETLNIKEYKVEDLKEAVEPAKKVTPKGSICLLSPAAASYGYFKNFEERGEKFEEYVKES